MDINTNDFSSTSVANAPVHRSSTDQSKKGKHRHRKLLRWWICSSVAFLFAVPLISIKIGLRLHARDFHYTADNSIIPHNDRTLEMEAVLINANPFDGSMTMDWTILGETASRCSEKSLDACTAVNIFFDTNLLTNNNNDELRTSDPPTNPIFRFNATAMAVLDHTAKTPTFRVSLALFSPRNGHSNLLHYPFDVYSSEILVFAQDAVSNATVGINLAITRGVAVGFKTNAITRPNVIIPTGMLDIVVILKRGNLVKAFSLVTVLSIWVITLILLLVMLTCVFFGFRQKSEILVIPVATVFAFTQLRGSMPGAPPGFGDILDFVGLLPCLAILSLCAAITLGAFIMSDPTTKPQALSWGLFFEAFPGLDPHRSRELEHEPEQTITRERNEIA